MIAELKEFYRKWDLISEADRVQQMRCFEQAIGNEAHESEALILLKILQAKYQIELRDLERGSILLDQAQKLIEQADAMQWLYEVQRYQSLILQRQGKNAEAFQILVKAYTSGQLFEDNWSLATITLNLGVLSANTGDYDGASVYLKRCIELAELAKITTAVPAHAHLVLAQAQLERGATDDARYHASQSVAKFQALGDQQRLISAAALLASINIECKDLASARSVLDSMDRTVLAKSQLISFLNLEAKLSSLEGKFDQALIAHDDAIQAATEISTERLWTNSVQLKCETLLLLERSTEAILLLDQIESFGTQGYDRLSLHELKGKALEQLGQYREALDEHKKFAILQKELLSERASNALSRLRAAQEVLQAEREAAHFRERSQFYAKELSQRTSYLVQQNEYVNNVIDHIQALASQRPDAIDLLKDIRKRLRQLPAASFDWNEYLRLFDEIHPNALTILEEKYPALTPIESKICSLVLSKLSNVDIARLLSLSERTVENHRYRLRKKLGISVDVDLTAFLERTLADRPADKLISQQSLERA